MPGLFQSVRNQANERPGVGGHRNGRHRHGRIASTPTASGAQPAASSSAARATETRTNAKSGGAQSPVKEYVGAAACDLEREHAEGEPCRQYEQRP